MTRAVVRPLRRGAPSLQRFRAIRVSVGSQARPRPRRRGRAVRVRATHSDRGAGVGLSGPLSGLARLDLDEGVDYRVRAIGDGCIAQQRPEALCKERVLRRAARRKRQEQCRPRRCRSARAIATASTIVSSMSPSSLAASVAVPNTSTSPSAAALRSLTFNTIPPPRPTRSRGQVLGRRERLCSESSASTPSQRHRTRSGEAPLVVATTRPARLRTPRGASRTPDAWRAHRPPPCTPRLQSWHPARVVRMPICVGGIGDDGRVGDPPTRRVRRPLPSYGDHASQDAQRLLERV